MVEGVGSVKHIIHIRYAAHIPLRDIPIEGAGSVEHPIHRCYVAHIPRGKIPIEGTGLVEHLIHIRNATGTGGGCICLGYLPFGAFGVGDRSPIYSYISRIAHTLAFVQTTVTPLERSLKFCALSAS